MLRNIPVPVNLAKETLGISPLVNVLKAEVKDNELYLYVSDGDETVEDLEEALLSYPDHTDRLRVNACYNG